MSLRRAFSIVSRLVSDPRIFARAAKVLREEDLSRFLLKSRHLVRSGRVYSYVEPTQNEPIRSEIATFDRCLLISIVMPVYNADPQYYLSAAIESARKQRYGHWELCIVDGAKPSIDQDIKFTKQY